jgi:predicted dehydrogenase
VLLPPSPELRQRVVVLGRPCIKHLDRLDEEPAHGRQGIFDHRRDNRIDFPIDQLSSVVANQRQRIKIVETGETIQMTAPDQVLLSGVLQSGAVASVHLKGGTSNGTRFLLEIHGTEGVLAIVPADPRQATYIQVSEFTVHGAQAGKPLADLSIPESYRRVPPAVPAGLPFNVAQLYMRMAEGIREGKPVSPDFDVAVKRHQLLDAIQKASDTGIRQTL